LFSMEEMIQAFSLKRVNKAGAKFDADKTKWFQQQYLRAESANSLAKMLRDQVTEPLADISDAYLEKACNLMKERATFVGDIYTEGQYLFENPAEFDKKTVNKKWKEEAEELMKEWSQELAAIESFDAANIEISFKSFLEKKEMGIGKVLPLIRLVLTGKGMGPSMFEITALIGKEESLSRMEKNIPSIVKMKA